MPAAAARLLLGVGGNASEVELRHAYREAAKQVHPDKTGEDSSTEFVQLREALDTLLLEITTVPPPPRPGCDGGDDGGTIKESDRLDKHFFGTRFGSDKFHPRAWGGEADDAVLLSGQPVQCVWRCRCCPEASSVCCRIKPKKHSCICGHKVDAHRQADGFSCGSKGCHCRRLQFHVQQLGWEVRCRCKHHVKDHSASGFHPWKCTKRLPGRDQKPCPCDGFDASWVCTCGHGWDLHETTWSAGVSKAVFAREWVAQGLRPECTEEALQKRTDWDNEASRVAAECGAEHASRFIAAKAKRLGVSMCAEARMHEAAQEALDGSRLPLSQMDNSRSQRLRPSANTCKEGSCRTVGRPRPIAGIPQQAVRSAAQQARSGVLAQSFAAKPRPTSARPEYSPNLRLPRKADPMLNCTDGAVSQISSFVDVAVEPGDLLTINTLRCT